MRSFAKPLVALVAVVVIAVIAYSLLPRNAGKIGGPASSPSASPSANPTTSPSASQATITLHAATIESDTSPAARALRTFAAEVARVTNGQVSVDVTIEAVPDVSSQEEHSLVTKVQSGAFDIAVVPTRAWGAEGVTSLHATMMPMLIDSDPLAAAVAKDAIAGTMLDGLSGVGLKGLTMWPEDLRHPASFGTPFLTPRAFAGVGTGCSRPTSRPA